VFQWLSNFAFEYAISVIQGTQELELNGAHQEVGMEVNTWYIFMSLYQSAGHNPKADM
jgi:hypothetical protein